MLQTGGDLDFAEKALRTECGYQLVAQELDGNQSVVLEVVRKVDRRHSASTKLALDTVAIS